MRSPWLPLLAIDALLVVLFAALGRQQHEEGLSPLGVLGTAAPFLVALVALSALTRVRQTHSSLWPAGVVVWAGTVALGVGLRLATGDTAAAPFVVVAAIVLAAFLLGRRALSGLVLRRKVRSTTGVD